MIQVFYDGKCGLCSKEILHYQKIAPQGVFLWQDVHESTDTLHKLGVTATEALEKLHVKDNEGQLHIGVDAFILIWSQLKRWQLLALLISLPLIKPFTRLIYQRFAKWRFKKAKQCQIK